MSKEDLTLVQNDELLYRAFVAYPRLHWKTSVLPEVFNQAVRDRVMLAAVAFEHPTGLFVVSSVDPSEQFVVQHLTFWRGGLDNVVRAGLNSEIRIRRDFDFCSNVVEVNPSSRKQTRHMIKSDNPQHRFAGARHLWKTVPVTVG